MDGEMRQLECSAAVRSAECQREQFYEVLCRAVQCSAMKLSEGEAQYCISIQ